MKAGKFFSSSKKVNKNVKSLLASKLKFICYFNDEFSQSAAVTE
jgi:hypothetical protein